MLYAILSLSVFPTENYIQTCTLIYIEMQLIKIRYDVQRLNRVTDFNSKNYYSSFVIDR